jgi:hypothetical protein
MSEPAADIGHNRPPPYDAAAVEAFIPKVREIGDAIGKRLEKPIETEADAEALSDFTTQVSKLIAQIEAKREVDKRPFIDGGRMVDSTYRALIEPLKLGLNRLKPLLTAHAKKKREAAEAQRRQALADAERAAEEAQREAEAAAGRKDVIGEHEAEEKARAARATIAQVAKAKRPTGAIGSATGGGRTKSLHTYHDAEVVNARVAFSALYDEFQPEFDALLERLASRKYATERTKISRGERAAGAIEVRGIRFHERQEIQ